MLRRNQNKNDLGQVMMEYMMIFGTIAMALVAMNMMIKRGVQGMIKTVADQVGTQINAEQKFGQDTHLEVSRVNTSTDSKKTKVERIGMINYIYDDTVTTDSVSVTNLGFERED